MTGLIQPGNGHGFGSTDIHFAECMRPSWGTYLETFDLLTPSQVCHCRAKTKVQGKENLAKPTTGLGLTAPFRTVHDKIWERKNEKRCVNASSTLDNCVKMDDQFSSALQQCFVAGRRKRGMLCTLVKKMKIIHGLLILFGFTSLLMLCFMYQN